MSRKYYEDLLKKFNLEYITHYRTRSGTRIKYRCNVCKETSTRVLTSFKKGTFDCEKCRNKVITKGYGEKLESLGFEYIEHYIAGTETRVVFRCKECFEEFDRQRANIMYAGSATCTECGFKTPIDGMTDSEEIAGTI